MTRLARLQSAIAQSNVDLLILGPGSHMRWLLGYSPHADERLCILLVTATESRFVAPKLNAQEMRSHVEIPCFEWDDAAGPTDALAAAIAHFSVAGSRVAIDDTLRADHAFLATAAMEPVLHCMASEIIGPLRMCKDAEEIAALKENAQIADAAHIAMRAALAEGMSERELANIARDCFEAHGAQMAFGIVGVGSNGAFPHHQTGGTVVTSNTPIVVDIGATKDGYFSDITRMMSLGAVSQEYLDVHAVVEAAVQAAIAAVRPGRLAQEIDAAARDVIAAAGFGDAFVHRTGHGLGGDIHEPPYITSNSAMPLRNGMVFTIEPGIYLPDRFGIRLEDVVVVTETGCEVLSQLSRDIHVVTS
jgi:Xaa-Pro aminopeptidase